MNRLLAIFAFASLLTLNLLLTGCGDSSSNTVQTTSQPNTHTYTGNVYTTTNNFTSCTTGTCANYTAAMKITGSFTTSAPLAANLVTSNIASLVTSYSFTDGINTYASTDSKARIFNFMVSTDSSGNITSTNILLEQWATVATTHANGDRFNYMVISPTTAQTFNNAVCDIVGVSTYSNISDVCTSANSGGSSQSYATANGVGTWN